MPNAPATVPGAHLKRSPETLPLTDSVVALPACTVPWKLHAWTCCDTAGVFGPKRFTLPLLSSGRMHEYCGKPPLDDSSSLPWAYEYDRSASQRSAMEPLMPPTSW